MKEGKAPRALRGSVTVAEMTVVYPDGMTIDTNMTDRGVAFDGVCLPLLPSSPPLSSSLPLSLLFFSYVFVRRQTMAFSEDSSPPLFRDNTSSAPPSSMSARERGEGRGEGERERREKEGGG